MCEWSNQRPARADAAGVAGTDDQARQFLGPWGERLLAFADPDREVIATLGSKEGFANMAQAIPITPWSIGPYEVAVTEVLVLLGSTRLDGS